MSRLILHIGAHKTGTTSVQHFFKAREAALGAHGVAYPLTGRLAAHYVFAAPWIGEMKPLYGFTPEDGREAWARLDADWAGFEGTVLISAEAFCHVRPDRVDFREVAALAARFDEVEVVYVARDQLSAIQSVFMEISRTRADWPRLELIFEVALMADSPFPLTFDHRVMLDHVEEGFDPTQIRFLGADRLQAAEGGIIGYFARLCGLPAEAVGEPARLNVSADPLAHYVAAELSAPGQVEVADIERCRAALEEVYGPGVRTTMFTREEIERARAVFCPANAALAERIVAHDDCAARLTLPRFEDHLTRDQLGEDFRAALRRAYPDRERIPVFG